MTTPRHVIDTSLMLVTAYHTVEGPSQKIDHICRGTTTNTDCFRCAELMSHVRSHALDHKSSANEDPPFSSTFLPVHVL